MNKQLVKNRINLTYDNGILYINRKNINLIDLKETISKEYYSLIEICIYHKLNFTFETGYILLTTGQLLVLPLKILNTYYFCVFNSNPNMMKKVKQFIKDDFRDKSYIIISKKDYDFIIQCFNNSSKYYELPIKEKYDKNKQYYCQYCGKLITTHTHKRIKKYCSKECLQASLNREVENECIYCHTKFKVKNIREKIYSILQ